MERRSLEEVQHAGGCNVLYDHNTFVLQEAISRKVSDDVDFLFIKGLVGFVLHHAVNR
jgi:hypothetical protein